MSIPYEPGEALTCGQIRELDVLAIEHAGVPGLLLMENAGRSVAELVYTTLIDPPRAHVAILCGPGNNGGDGFVVARHLANAGVHVTCILAAERTRYGQDAAVNLAILERIELPMIDASGLVDGPRADGPRADAARREIDVCLHPHAEGALRPCSATRREIEVCLNRSDVIIDALLGTGSSGRPRPPLDRLIELANGVATARRVAIDVPSGLDADRGEVTEPCFRAHATVTLVAEKVGFGTLDARGVLGRVIVADIGAPRGLIPGRKNLSKRA